MSNRCKENKKIERKTAVEQQVYIEQIEKQEERKNKKKKQ